MIADVLIGAAIEEAARDAPPSTPNPGSCYIVGDAPTGDWSAAANHLASYSSSGWRFVPPVDGLVVLNKSDGTIATYWAGAWHAGTVRAASVVIDGQQVLGPRTSAIANPAGGSTVDTEARETIGQVLSALRQHGLIAV